MGSDRRCEICDRPLLRSSNGTGICLSAHCQQTHRERQWRQNQAELLERARQLRNRTAPALGIADADSFPPVLIPTFEARVVELPEQRKQAFRAHLSRVISEAAGEPTPPPDAVVPEPAISEAGSLLGRACATCRGFCCRHGGDKAYIRADTIRRYLAERPDRQPHQILEDYLSRVGERTYRNSCIFHGTDGCNLPRELRSDTCNRHFCDSLRDFQHGNSGKEPVRAFFVSVRGMTFKAATFADCESAHPVPTEQGETEPSGPR